ncbi:MAG: PAS domain S-box protein [Cyclobacteriaceae bacterium]|nr:PAS domain S-box protein [Cyclobacteriaceae bacterium]
MIDLNPIIDTIEAVVFVHDSETGEVLYVNKACEEFYGYSSKQLMGKGVSLISTNDQEYNFTNAQTLIQKAANGQSQTFEWRNVKVSGEKLWVEVVLNSVMLGKDKRVVAIVKDITQQKENRLTLELNERFQLTINSIIEAIFPLKEEEEVLWNFAESCGKTLGLEDLVLYILTDDNQLVQRSGYGKKVAGYRQLKSPLTLLMSEGIVGYVAGSKESEIINDVEKDDRYVPDFQVNGSEIAVPLLFGDKLLGVIDSEHSKKSFFTTFHQNILETVASLVAIKISQARSYEREKESQAKINAVLNSNPDLVFILSEERRFEEIYTKNQHLLAAPKEQLLGTLIDDHLEKHEVVLMKEIINNLFDKGTTNSIEYERKSNDGIERWFLTNGSLVEFKGKRSILLMSSDITSKKKIQQKIESNEKLLTSINKNISEGLYRSYSVGGLVYANDAFAKMFGYNNAEEILKVESLDLYANPVDRKGETPSILKTGYRSNIETQFKRKDGTTFWGLNSFMLTKDHNGRNIFDGAIRDITEQRQNQLKIEENEMILSSINKNIPDGIYRSHSKGALIYVNDAFVKMFGYNNAEEILKVDSHSLYVDPVDRERKTHENFEKGSKLETHFKRKDGSMFWGLDSFVLTTDHEGNDIYDGAIRDISIEKQVTEKLNNLNAEFLERNITLAQKEKELESSNEELRSNRDSLVETLNELSDRNFELDQLVYKTSHDLRSPLRSILGLTNLMKMDNPQFDNDYVNKIDDRILKMDDFIKSMLDYSMASRMDIKKEEANLENLIADCFSDLEYLDGFNQFRIETSFARGKKILKIDVLHNRIVFSNIISNAYKYRNTNSKDSYLKISISIAEDKYTVLFEDNGIGISKEYLDKVFDMFFRATEKSDGSGLGMYIVKQAIDRMNGTIDIKSKMGKGTTIEIEVPV